jgi:hypothetical protein
MHNHYLEPFDLSEQIFIITSKMLNFVIANMICGVYVVIVACVAQSNFFALNTRASKIETTNMQLF